MLENLYGKVSSDALNHFIPPTLILVAQEQSVQATTQWLYFGVIFSLREKVVEPQSEHFNFPRFILHSPIVCDFENHRKLFH